MRVLRQNLRSFALWDFSHLCTKCVPNHSENHKLKIQNIFRIVSPKKHQKQDIQKLGGTDGSIFYFMLVVDGLNIISSMVIL